MMYNINFKPVLTKFRLCYETQAYPRPQIGPFQLSFSWNDLLDSRWAYQDQINDTTLLSLSSFSRVHTTHTNDTIPFPRSIIKEEAIAERVSRSLPWLSIKNNGASLKTILTIEVTFYHQTESHENHKFYKVDSFGTRPLKKKMIRLSLLIVNLI